MILLQDFVAQSVEANFVGEDVYWDGERPAKSPGALIIVKYRVEARSVAVKEVFVPYWVVVAIESYAVAEQSVGKTCESSPARLEAQTADVEDDLVVYSSASRSVECPSGSSRRQGHIFVVVVERATSGTVDIVGGREVSGA